MKNLVIKKCTSCGAMIEVIKDCDCADCGITCCGKPMTVVKENTSDGAVEKHKPVVEIVGNYIVVTVPHVMEADHYIEWIALVSDKTNGKKFLKPSENAVAVFPYIKGSKVYEYCNRHGLWSTEVK